MPNLVRQLPAEQVLAVRVARPRRVVKPRARTVAEDILRISRQLRPRSPGSREGAREGRRIVRRHGEGLESFYAIGFIEREALDSVGAAVCGGDEGALHLCPVDTRVGSGIPPVPTWLTWSQALQAARRRLARQERSHWS